MHFNLKKMNEGRRSQVVLLDDRRLDILIQPKLYACDLLDIVASHFCLREKEYFGLAYLDDTGHYHWLQLDKRVLEHDLPRKATQGVLVLHFLVKYYVESISLLRDSATVEAFYLQCKSLVGKGTIEADADTVFQLAALVLQATYGNYADDQTAKNHLKKLPVLPTSALKEHPSIAYCENKVIEKYKDAAGLSRGSAIVSYMNIVETLPTYGIHFYEVKDKGGIPWWIGLSYKGISQYDYNDRKVPRKFFQWKLLENLYFRDKKFSIEVHNPRRVSVSRRTFGPGNVTVLVWFAATPSLTKCIWSMAIAQHQFYIDHKADRKKLEDSSNLERIAAELSKSCQSLSSSSTGSNLSRSASSHSLPTIKIEGNQKEESEAAREELMCALKARKEALEEVLSKKLEELKALCMKEGELTGEVPPEIPLEPGESMPQVRRRVGTSFLINDQLISKAKTQEEVLSRLELEYELQNKITSAALRLASDTAADRSLRRQRKITYQQEYTKLRQVRDKLSTMKRNVNEAKTGQLTEEQCDDNVSRSTADSDAVLNDGSNPSEASLSPSPNFPACDALSLNLVSPAISVSAPPSPSKRRTASPAVSTGLRSRYGQGYAPSTVYQTAYRRQQYPTLSLGDTGLEPASNGEVHLRSPYKNKFESGLSIEGSNLYSVQTQRTSRAFDSQDDILAGSPPEPQDLGLVCRHNSLESKRRHQRRTRTSPVTAGHSRHPECLRSASLVDASYPSPSATDTSGLAIDLAVATRRPVVASASYPEGLPAYSREQAAQISCGMRKTQPCKARSEGFVMPGGEQSASFCVGSPDVNRRFSSQESSLPRNRREKKRIGGTVADVTDGVENAQSGESAQYVGLHAAPKLETFREPSYGTQYLNACLSSSRNFPQAPVQAADSQQSKPRAKDWVETSLDSPVPVRKAPLPDASPIRRHDGVRSPHESGERLPSRPSSRQNVYPSDGPHSPVPVRLPPPGAVEVNVVTVGHFRPYWEETKPYEMSDFYKYSTKHRKRSTSDNQEMAAEGPTSPSSPAGRCDRPGSAVASRSLISSPEPSDRGPPTPLQHPSSLDTSLKLNLSPVADQFHAECIAWYEDQDSCNTATLV